MPKERKYALVVCHDCMMEFIAPAKHVKHNYFCPICGENVETKLERHLWLKRFYDQKQRWTKEEDQIIMYGKNKGSSNDEISEALGNRTSQAVRRRWQRLNGSK